MPGPAALSTKHTLAAHQPGRRDRRRRRWPWPGEIRDGVQDAFGVSLVNEPVLVGTTL